MNSRKTVVIEDANIWISFLIGSRYGDIINVLDDPEYRIVYCKDLIEELFASLSKPKLAKFYTRDEVVALTTAIKRKAIEIKIQPPYPERTRDKKDDYLLELAIQAEADFLVSGDKDLLDLKRIGKTEILTLSSFAVKYYSAKTKKYQELIKKNYDEAINKVNPSYRHRR